MQSVYWQQHKNTRIAVLGICPPPLGGVSVHVSRLIEHLKGHQNEVFFFNTEPRYRYRLIYCYLFTLIPWLCWVRPRVVIYHSGYLPNSVTELRVLLQLKKYIPFSLQVVEHNCQHLDKRSARQKKIWQEIVNNVDEMVLIGDTTLLSYERNNIMLKNYMIDSPFLPWQGVSAISGDHDFQQSLGHFHVSVPIIFMNASQVKLLKNGDLYGFDTALAMMAQLKKNYPTLQLIIFLARIGDKVYFARLEEKIIEYDLKNSILFVHSNKPMWPLLPLAHCFIRPTRVDSFGISIAEAIYAHVPAIASDVCKRPAGTIIFKAGDANDLADRVREVFIAKGFLPIVSDSST